MMPRHPIAQLFWLVALLVAGLGLFAPATVLAHPGHGHEPGGSSAMLEVLAPAASLDLEWLDPLAAPAAQQALVLVTVPGSADASACGGAGCCNTGHGCCAVILSACPVPWAVPRATPPGVILAGLPPGLDAATLPEPPRPFR